jgi:uncharacterized SAM-binding protein YcdF (DUF218 family)
MTGLAGVLTSLLISPLSVAVLLGAGVLLGALGRKRASLILVSSTTALVLLLSTGAVSSLLLRPLEYRYPPWPAAGVVGAGMKVDAVVVLGSGVRQGAPDESGRSALDEVGLVRLVEGFTLSQQLGVPIIVSGGSTWREGGGETEADTAARVLERLGAPASRVIREGKSRTTWENAREVSRIAADRGFRTLALVTSAWHMPRAMMAFRRAGVQTIPAPTGFLTEGRALLARDFLPGFPSLQDSALALREYLGILDYSARR